ncbi:hypothetical protein ACFOY2_53830 [Nonomuraea purpurea]|uniref:Uncharacterized protein n=1 Tax=Nonomuraea purpurea TaxID=1849276 RepID=A0ABV8GR60_9ACTN
MARLTLACEHLSGGTLVFVGGEVDARNAARLKVHLDQVRRRRGEPL